MYCVDKVIAPLMEDERKKEKFVAIRHDVTLRKLTEQQLRSSEAFLERASRIAGVGGWQVTLNTNDMTWSDQACTIYGLPRGHAGSAEEGMSFVLPEWRAPFLKALLEARQTHTVVDMELPAINAIERAMWLRVVAEYEYEQGKPVRLVGTSQDITE